MMTDSEGNEVLSDEDALAFMFAVHASGDGAEGMLSIPQPHRHRLIERALHKIVTQFEVELGIPWVRGRFRGLGAVVVHLDKPDFSEHTKLYDPNSFGVLDVHTEKNQFNGDVLYAGFDAYIRLGESNTWLCIGIKPPSPENEQGILDFSDETAELHNEEITFHDETEGRLSKENDETLADIAARIAVADGFGAVAMRIEPRRDFSKKFVDKHFEEFIDLDPFIRKNTIYEWAGDIARNYWEFVVIPMRAQKLEQAGKSIPQIAKELGITKQRAERAVEMDIESGINSGAINARVSKYLEPR